MREELYLLLLWAMKELGVLREYVREILFRIRLPVEMDDGRKDETISRQRIAANAITRMLMELIVAFITQS